ncbi:MAG: four helix bundle protein [Lacibacter sp.]|jgi:four helix bundle protein
MEKDKSKFDLEDRLVAFACMCLDVCDILPNTKSGQNLEYQLSKSGTAPALIYGEAQAAESRADFIHKMRLCLKEIKESRINLKIIRQKPVVRHACVEKAFNESNELMAIFLTSIETAQRNNLKRTKL